MNVLRVVQVAERFAVSPQTIWGWVRDGQFPQPFKLAPRVTVWDEADIDSWLAQQKEKSNESLGTA